MDKMHCYFQHCFDIGNRLSITEKNKISDQVSGNVDLLKINQILTTKKKINRSSCCRLTERMHHKYDQFLVEFKDDENSVIQEDNTYSTGFKFDYGHIEGDCIDNTKPVLPKYSSLKEELTTNDLSIISMEQFNNEYEKAEIHFHSEYCRSQYMPFDDGSRVFSSPMDRNWHQALFRTEKEECKNVIKLEYLLSLMVYCNYDQLQLDFSKTYRLENGKQHDNFYHLGKYLSISTRIFGVCWRETTKSKPDSLYHGIGKKLSFPAYVNILVQGPLSTSSSFAVAANFTNHNNGLIIEFSSNTPHPSKVRYFPVAWLSDYANEFEHLFIQNVDDPLIINDIVDVTFDVQYEKILVALLRIHNIVTEFSPQEVETNVMCICGKAFEQVLQQHCYGGSGVGCDECSMSMQEDMIVYHCSNEETQTHANGYDLCSKCATKQQLGTYSMKVLIDAIISNQLSYQLSNYKPFDSLTEFGKSMITTSFQNERDILINRPLLPQFLYHSDCDFIDLNLMQILFPNIEIIHIYGVNLNTLIIEYIITYLKTRNAKSKLNLIQISTSEMDSESTSESDNKSMTQHSELSEKDGHLKWLKKEALKKYTKSFRKLQTFIYLDPIDTLCIISDSCPCEFVMKWLNSIFDDTDCYFEDPDDELKHILHEFITTKIGNNALNYANDQELSFAKLSRNVCEYIDNHQLQFNEYCNEKTYIKMSWDRDHYRNKENILYLLKLFCYSDYDWIKMDFLTLIYPNIHSIQIEEINLCPWILNHILVYLKNNRTKLNKITIYPDKTCTTLTVLSAAINYKSQFEEIKYSINPDDYGQLNIEKMGKNVSDSNSNQTNVMCICGKPFEQLLQQNCYGGTGVGCDGCSMQIERDKIVYHCPNEKTKMHENGYDLCSKCATNNINNNITQQLETDNDDQIINID